MSCLFTEKDIVAISCARAFESNKAVPAEKEKKLD